MTIDNNQFWNLLSETQLVPVSQVQALFSEYSADPKLDDSPESLQQWLVDQKAISPYQAKIISAGHSGPFRFGNYTIVERLEEGNLAGVFIGKHTKTGYRVLLQFIPGSLPEHLAESKTVEGLTEQLQTIKNAHVAETFEFVTLPNHRFVVSEIPRGTPVSEKLPRKARLAWQKACALIAQAAKGLHAIHQAGAMHNAVSPQAIWLEKSGSVQLRLSPISTEPARDTTPETGEESQHDYASPESAEPKNQLGPSSDVYSLGCTLYRIISGRVPFPGDDVKKKQRQHQTESPPGLSKYDLPKELESILTQMMAKDPGTRPKLPEIANLLALHSGKAGEIHAHQYQPSKTRMAYLNSIRQFLPGADQKVVSALPEISSEPELSISPEAQAERAAKIQAATNAAQRRKHGRWKIPLAIGSALVMLSIALGISAYFADQTAVNEPGPAPGPEVPAGPENPDISTEDVDNQPDLAALPPRLRPTVFQEIIDDDRESIWESPTNGPPIEFSYLPPTPKLLFVFQLASLVEQEEGQRLLQSWGPEFVKQIEQFKNQSGLDLENIQQLVVSLHTNDNFEYDPYFIVQTTKPVTLDRMLQNWNRPTRNQLENQQDIYLANGSQTAFYVLNTDQANDYDKAEQDSDETTGDDDIEGDEAAVNTDTLVTRFAFGNRSLVEQVALSAGADVLSGSLREMADWTDRDRHMNVLFLRNALFNDEGQTLMGEKLKAFNRQLDLSVPDEVKGGLLSFHLDSGTYFEVMLDRNIDLKADDLKQQLVDESRSQRDTLMNFVAGIPSSPYWDRVRIRFGGMLADLYKNLRWDVEHGVVIANCWLPPMAAHNLFAASELVLSFSSGAAASEAVVKSGPQTLDELLEIKRDLDIANPPDLNVLMSDLKTEIEDDLGKMPFAFNIRLLGGDLEAQGITKNQRPSELVLKQKSLAEILTYIMISANPDKDITGASDPGCELIWVVADDPQSPGDKAILITTRTAAAEKSYELPEAFRAE